MRTVLVILLATGCGYARAMVGTTISSDGNIGARGAVGAGACGGLGIFLCAGVEMGVSEIDDDASLELRATLGIAIEAAAKGVVHADGGVTKRVGEEGFAGAFDLVGVVTPWETERDYVGESGNAVYVGRHGPGLAVGADSRSWWLGLVYEFFSSLWIG